MALGKKGATMENTLYYGDNLDILRRSGLPALRQLILDEGQDLNEFYRLSKREK